MSRAKSASLPGKPLPPDAERPTDEALQHGEYEVREIEPDGAGGAVTVRAAVHVTCRPIDRARRRGHITDRQWAAGDRLMTDWYLAGLSPRITADLLSAGGGGETSYGMASTERQYAARVRIRHAMDALGRTLGRAVQLLLVEEVTVSAWAAAEHGVRGDRPQSAAGMTALRLALDSLADHYGMP